MEVNSGGELNMEAGFGSDSFNRVEQKKVN